jgi:uncharacterized damage-inducible protein DinB
MSIAVVDNESEVFCYMQMKQYLIETFQYNDHANKLALRKVGELPEKDECIRFFSHLINSMNKWLGRIEKWGEDVEFPRGVMLPESHEPPADAARESGGDRGLATLQSRLGRLIMNKETVPTGPRKSYKDMDWWLPVNKIEDLEPQWDASLKRWLDFINAKTEEELSEEVEFYGFDGGDWAAVIKDIALQLNYHSIHHRAQIQYLIRHQGIEPAFVDYIGTKYRKLN